MAAIASPSPLGTSFEGWLPEFLRHELAPYPGRAAIVSRIVIGVVLTFILIAAFRINQGAALSLYYVFSITRESPGAAFRGALLSIGAAATGIFWFLLGAELFVDYQLTHFLFIVLSYFLLFFFSRILVRQSLLTTCAIGFYQASLFWERPFPAEPHLEDCLWVLASLTIGTLVGAMGEFLFVKQRPFEQLVSDLNTRLVAVQKLLTAYAERGAGAADSPEAEEVSRLVMVGTGRLRREVKVAEAGRLRSPQAAIEMRTLIALAGRLVDLAAALKGFAVFPDASDRERLVQASTEINRIRTNLLSGQRPSVSVVADGTRYSPGVALLPELEKAISLIPQAFSGSNLEEFGISFPVDPEMKAHWFVPDALSNPEYLRFALKGCLATMICYVIYNAIAWPGIATSTVSSVVIALSTIGASHQKAYLRLAGVALGGVLAILSLVFLFPGIGQITTLLLLLAVVTAITGWISTSSPRLSYVGAQAALAFYLAVIQDFQTPTSLSPPRDRFFGVLLAVLVLSAVSDTIWPTRAVIEMRNLFSLTLRRMAELAILPNAGRRADAMRQFRDLRELVSAGFLTVHAHADSVAYEFGPDRSHQLAVREHILQRQAVARTLFLIELAIARYFFQRDTMTLPAGLRAAYANFGDQAAQNLRTLADRVSGLPAVYDREAMERAVRNLEQEIRLFSAPAPDGELGGREAGILSLARQFASISGSLADEIAATG